MASESVKATAVADAEAVTMDALAGSPKKEREDDDDIAIMPVRRRNARMGWSALIRRTRSINAPVPSPSFGPKAMLKRVPVSQIMHVTDPSSQRLVWKATPLSVLIIKKIFDTSVLGPFKEMTKWLSQEKNLVIYVEGKVQEDEDLLANKEFSTLMKKFKTFKEGDDLSDRIDFIICLGGDGTLLWASSLFQEGSVPPVMAYHLGSLGFLTPFEFEDFKGSVNVFLEGNAAVTLRSRLKCLIFENSEIPNGLEVDNSDALKPPSKKPDPPNLKFKFQVMNDVVIDRGPSPYLSNLDLFIDGRHVTTVQGDGLIISTPTGSTAYAAAAGAAMVHPNVPAILITPICPHTLSFRPIVVPAGVELKVSVSPDARHTAWASLDGRNRQELKKGFCLRITTSVYPVASVCSIDQICDWFDSLVECLHWNERQTQKSSRSKIKDKSSNNNNKQNGGSSSPD
ncbi:NAD kinase [Strongylocentrotus purpuratus]|uniref:NAD(+) kinase n=1 Tax=Strongylocentrotus purpuratus TaxID=7668 RepID=C3RSF7_STRPU|nr:NAD kinase [Strongylocentrotus purpuratus]ABY58957.1 NAD kinase isoform 2 [Strongylocentrotus purpuratus]|eukprot:NP_001154910.1 NAD kinase [Strongylocentrotus purpuratus]